MSSDTTVGQVKWFNNKAGYGFITAKDANGTVSDIFCHYTNLKVDESQYKYLVQGEYVEFVIAPATGAHEIQATQITGINGGQLMCQTRKLNAPVDRPQTARRPQGTGDRAPRRSANLQRTASTGVSTGVSVGVSNSTSQENGESDGFKKVTKKKRVAV